MIRSLNGFYNQLLAMSGEDMEAGNLGRAKKLLDSANELAIKYPSQIIQSENINAIEQNLNHYVYLNEIEKGKNYLLRITSIWHSFTCTALLSWK
jgi:hypothetical protein